MPKTIFSGAISRFLHQQKRITVYMKFFYQSLILRKPNEREEMKKVGQFHAELLIISLFSFFEEFLKNIIFSAALHQLDATREYFKKYGKLATREAVKKM